MLWHIYIKRHLKCGFSTLIHIIHARNNFICYAVEGHINVGWGPRPTLVLLVEQWLLGFIPVSLKAVIFNKLPKLAEKYKEKHYLSDFKVT